MTSVPSLVHQLCYVPRVGRANGSPSRSRPLKRRLTRLVRIFLQQYNIALTAFFFSYSLFEPPSNVLLKRLKPNVWLSGIMFLWGICESATPSARSVCPAPPSSRRSARPVHPSPDWEATCASASKCRRAWLTQSVSFLSVRHARPGCSDKLRSTRCGTSSTGID